MSIGIFVSAAIDVSNPTLTPVKNSEKNRNRILLEPNQQINGLFVKTYHGVTLLDVKVYLHERILQVNQICILIACGMCTLRATVNCRPIESVDDFFSISQHFCNVCFSS